MDYNYVELNKEFFPTKCAGYPANIKIETRMMTVNDVKLIAMLNETNSAQIIKEILRRCCRFTNMTVNDLYLADRNFLMLWLRSGSFIDNNGYTFTYEHCPHCHKKITINLPLAEMQLDVCTEFKKIVNINGYDITFKLPKIDDVQVKLSDKELEHAINYTNLVEIFGSVQNAITELLQWDALSYITVINIANSMKCGIKSELELTCPQCNNTINELANFTDADIAGKADLTEILRNILAISKYCNFQITDDMIFAEVEIMGKIVSEMIEAENKAYEQSQGQQTLTR